ncbi:MAG: alkaline phosphatase D family protein [Opitutaceae bacterium]
MKHPSTPASPSTSNSGHLSRRAFLQQTTAVALTTQMPSLLRAASAPASTDFHSVWDQAPDRVWLGPDCWANPLQDWRISNGRIECDHAAPDRNVHVLTRQLGERRGNFAMSARLGRAGGGAFGGGQGSVGFRVGIEGPLREYRNSLIFGEGLDAGIGGDGVLFIGDLSGERPPALASDVEAVELKLTAEPVSDSDGEYEVRLAALDPAGRELGAITRSVPARRLVGNLALVCNFDIAAKRNAAARDWGAGRFWFSDWTIAGSKIEAHPERAFGPILFSHYTLSGGVLKMTAQMPPLGVEDAQNVRLQLQRDGAWQTIAEEPILPDARTATFRIERWDGTRDWSYRLVYDPAARDGGGAGHHWTGIVRRDPVDEPEFIVGDVSCNIHAAFPNAPYVANMAKLNPDLLAFVGDQFYESSGGYGIVRAPLEKATIDYLRKWYMHGWTWRELMRDRPSVSLPDDHDVYHGNLWGEGGSEASGSIDAGGYQMPAEWVNAVHRTQTAHHPDACDPSPGERGTINWYGPLTYGGVSFAILADRQYKSGPQGTTPETDSPRADHVHDVNFDPAAADAPGLELLGAKQEQFLREWARDWRGAEMKAVISQTIFTAMSTTHGRERMILRADYDANGWPQTPRDRALREMRKAFAFHIAGDQHLPALVHYGIDAHRDGPVAFAGPAVNVGYPRWWEPQAAPWTHAQGGGFTGDFTDSFGSPLTVLAVRNGLMDPRTGDVLQLMDDKASGLGLVRFDKPKRTITIECWSFLADPAQPGTQSPGWPVTVSMLENYGRKAEAHLPRLRITGIEKPVVEVIDDRSGELVYALRVASLEFQPHVFAPGRYTVRISEPETGRSKELTALEARDDQSETLEVSV